MELYIQCTNIVRYLKLSYIIFFCFPGLRDLVGPLKVGTALKTGVQINRKGQPRTAVSRF